MEEIDVSIPILIAMVFISLFVAGMVFDRHDEKNVSDNLIGYVVYNESKITAKQLEGKILDVCYLVDNLYKKEWRCGFIKLVNCRNGRCDVVEYNGNVTCDEIFNVNYSKAIVVNVTPIIEEIGGEE